MIDYEHLERVLAITRETDLQFSRNMYACASSHKFVEFVSCAADTREPGLCCMVCMGEDGYNEFSAIE